MGCKSSSAFLRETAMLTSLLYYLNSRRPLQTLSSTAQEHTHTVEAETESEREAKAGITLTQLGRRNEK